MTPGAAAADMRRRLRRRPGAAHLLWRIAQILRDGHAIRFMVHDATARAWHAGDTAGLERAIDIVAERYHRTTMAVDVDGNILYQRMLVA